MNDISEINESQIKTPNALSYYKLHKHNFDKHRQELCQCVICGRIVKRCSIWAHKRTKSCLNYSMVDDTSKIRLF